MLYDWKGKRCICIFTAASMFRFNWKLLCRWLLDFKLVFIGEHLRFVLLFLRY